MKIIFETIDDCFLITPLVSLVHVRCDHCEESHGVSISLGWFIWQLNFLFESQPH